MGHNKGIQTWCDFIEWLIEIQKDTGSIEMETLILDAQDKLFDLLNVKWR